MQATFQSDGNFTVLTDTAYEAIKQEVEDLKKMTAQMSQEINKASLWRNELLAENAKLKNEKQYLYNRLATSEVRNQDMVRTLVTIRNQTYRVFNN